MNRKQYCCRHKVQGHQFNTKKNKTTYLGCLSLTLKGNDGNQSRFIHRMKLETYCEGWSKFHN